MCWKKWTRSLKRQVEDKKQVMDVNLPADLPAVWLIHRVSRKS